MKCQDVFLLIKLTSLADALERSPSPLLDDAVWRDWDTEDAALALDEHGLPKTPQLPRAPDDRSNTRQHPDDPSSAPQILAEVTASAVQTDASGSPMPTATRVSLTDTFSVRSLANATGIGKSEVSNILRRCYENGLARPPRDDAGPAVNRAALVDFLIHGARYVFPVKALHLTRGIATGVNAPVFAGALRAASDTGPVWADPKGATMGFSIEPLYKTVPFAVRSDPQLYATLALIDSLRIGQPRERQLAAKMLTDIMGH